MLQTKTAKKKETVHQWINNTGVILASVKSSTSAYHSYDIRHSWKSSQGDVAIQNKLSDRDGWRNIYKKAAYLYFNMAQATYAYNLSLKFCKKRVFSPVKLKDFRHPWEPWYQYI